MRVAGKRVIKFLGAKGKAFRSEIDNRYRGKEVPYPRAFKLAVKIEINQPDRRKRDIDNIIKPTLDALIGIAYEDDSQIDYLTVIRGDKVEGGKMTVTIHRLEETDGN